LQSGLASAFGRDHSTRTTRKEKVSVMKYGLAWLLGVPPVIIAGWFLLNHC